MHRRVALAHEPDAGVPAFGTPDGNDPGESARRDLPSEMHLDVARHGRGQFGLGRLEVCGRQPETKAPLQPIAGAARQDDRSAPGTFAVAELECDAVAIDMHIVHTAAELDRCA